MNEKLLKQVLLVESQKDADTLLELCIYEIRNFTFTCMKLSIEEADRIARKNLIVTAYKLVPERLSEIEIFYKCKNPLTI